LGALAATGLLPVKEKSLIQTIKGHVPERFVKENLSAFDAGKRAFASK